MKWKYLQRQPAREELRLWGLFKFKMSVVRKQSQKLNEGAFRKHLGFLSSFVPNKRFEPFKSVVPILSTQQSFVAKKLND